MKHFATLFLFTCITKVLYCQEIGDIILQYTGQEVTLRKTGENHLMQYSEKNNRMILSDVDKESYPDSVYYKVNSVVTIFKVKENQYSKTDTVVRILFFYYKQNQNGERIRREAETYSNLSYNLTPPAKVKEVKEATGEKIHLILKYRSKNSDFIIEKKGEKGANIFFIYTDNEMPSLSYALLISNSKATIIQGEKIN